MLFRSDSHVTSLDKIKASLASNATKAEDLNKAATELRQHVQDYQTKWTKVGTTIRTTAIAAARAAGIPVPNLSLPGSSSQS